MLSSLVAVTRAALISEDLDLFLELALARATAVLAAPRVAIFLVDEASGELTPRKSAGFADELADVALRPGEGISGRVVEQKNLVTVRHASDEAGAAPYVKKNEIKSAVGVPLQIHERVIGALEIDFQTECEFSADEINFAQALANLVASAIEDARFHDERREETRRLQAFMRMSQAMVQTLNLDELLRGIAEQVSQFLGIEAVTILLVENDRMVRKVALGLPDEIWTEPPSHLGEGVAGTVAAKGELLLGVDIPVKVAITSQAIRRAGLYPLAAIPMKAKERVVGVLAVFSRRVTELPDQNLALLVTAANDAAAAIENARLFAGERRAREEALLFQEVARYVAAQEDLAKLLDVLVCEAVSLFDADFGVVTTTDPDTGRTVWRAAAGLTTDVYGTKVFAPGEGISGQTLTSGRLLVIERFGENPEFPGEDYPLLVQEGARAALSVPLIAAGTPYGVLIIGYRTDHKFADRETRLAFALGNEAVIAIQNVQLLESERKAREDTERRASRSAAISEVAMAALSGTPYLEDVARRIVEATAKALQVQAGLYMRDATGNTASLLPYSVSPGQVIEEFRQIPLDDSTMTGRAIVTGLPQVVLGPPLPPLSRRIAEVTGLESFASVPVEAGGEVVGALTIGLPAGRGLAEEELHTIQTIAAQAGAAIQNALLYERMRDLSSRLTVEMTRTHEAAEEAQRRAKEMNALLESLTEGVTIVDGQGTVVFFNAVGREIWGLTPSDEGLRPDQYRRLDIRTPDGRIIPFEEWPISLALRGESFSGYEIVFTRADGLQKWLSFSGSAVRDEEGRVVLAINVYRDVTALRVLERQREDYVRAISHDLRAPLTTILGQAQMIERAVRDGNIERIKRGAAAIVSGSKRMNAMIEDMAEVIRAEAGLLELHPQPVDLREFVLDLTERLSALAEARRIRLEIVKPIPPVLADPDRLERILTNLLTNALKYSSSDTEVVVRLKQRADTAITSISDRGIGIAPEDLPHIFDRFYRAKGGRKAEGLGLGLYIARMLVEAHRGQIWVESEPDKGSTFGFSLPLA